MDEQKNKGGRPSDYTPEIADAICARLANGDSLRTICRDDDMPSVVTVFAWIRKHEEFLKQYTRAKEESSDALVEEMMDISDDGKNDWMEIRDKDDEIVGWRVNGEAVQRSKLRIDTRKWVASKLKPKKYGDKMDLTSDGEKLEGVVIYKPSKGGAGA